MKYGSLGNTELQLSLIGLGTMTWGEQNDLQQACEQMDYAVSRGVIFLMSLRCTQCLRTRIWREQQRLVSANGLPSRIGATTMQQLKENIDAVDVSLSREVLDKIEAVHNCYTDPTP